MDRIDAIEIIIEAETVISTGNHGHEYDALLDKLVTVRQYVNELHKALLASLAVISQHYPEDGTCCKGKIAQINAALGRELPESSSEEANDE